MKSSDAHDMGQAGMLNGDINPTAALFMEQMALVNRLNACTPSSATYAELGIDEVLCPADEIDDLDLVTDRLLETLNDSAMFLRKFHTLASDLPEAGQVLLLMMRAQIAVRDLLLKDFASQAGSAGVRLAANDILAQLLIPQSQLEFDVLVHAESPQQHQQPQQPKVCIITISIIVFIP